MSLPLEQRISAFLHDSFEGMRGLASALSLKLRHVSTRWFSSRREAKVSRGTGERLDIRDLRGVGGIRSDYDHKALRTEDTHRS